MSSYFRCAICFLIGLSATAADVVIEDFEGKSFEKWAVIGDAFGSGPAAGGVGRQKSFKGIVGKRAANSFHADDAGQGTLTSPDFKITKKYINFRIGGGNHPGKTCANLLVDGKIVRTSVGPKRGDMVDQSWDVNEFSGKLAKIQVVDATPDGWGYVAVDHFVGSDKPTATTGNLVARPTAPGTANKKKSREEFLTQVKLTEGLSISLYADQGMVVNPTALCLDDQNRVYVAESRRWRKGVEDNRFHRYWLMDDAANASVADRLAMYEKWAAKQKPMSYFTSASESVKLLVDTDGDGRADKSTVFADGFNTALDGTAGGVLMHEGTVYFSCIPNLWALRDTTGDGVADVRTVVQHGFGVRVSISGHDMNACVTGPDGKLYFSIGDRGFNFTNKEGKLLKETHGGALLRCNPDGTNMEIYFRTLRNPKEIAFDEYGRLFSVDNDANVDRSRLVYLLEGGEAGWHTGHQMLADFGPEVGLTRGRPSTWFDEGLWKVRFPEQPAYILPPVAYVTDGPCGLTYNPGSVALPDRYKKHFFVTDYRASANKSGIYAFAVEDAGAGFKMVDDHKFAWGICDTDVEFGTDGKLYVTDFVGGWTGMDSGYVYTIADESKLDSPAVKEAHQILSSGIEKQSDARLYALLFNADQRIRQRAQFALVKRGDAGKALLKQALGQSVHELASLHGLWGIGQLLRTHKELQTDVLAALSNPSEHVRAQAAVILGDHQVLEASRSLQNLLQDPSLRVRALAAIALGKLKDPEALKPLLAMIKANNDVDAFLRHGGVMGLVGCGTTTTLLKAAQSATSAERLACLLAIRRHHVPEITHFLNDADPFIVNETIRAINDENIVEAVPRLATVLDNPPENLTKLQTYRLLNANLRAGDNASLKRLFAFAADAKHEHAAREEALRLVAQWLEPHPMDSTIALYRPLPARDAAEWTPMLKEQIQRLLKVADASIAGTAIRLATQYKVEISPTVLETQARGVELAAETRLAALAQLVDGKSAQAHQICLDLTKDDAREVRIGALQLLAKLDAKSAIVAVENVLATGEIWEKQQAYTIIGTIPGSASAKILIDGIESIIAKKAPLAIHLDVLLAAEQHDSPAVKAALKAYNESLSKDDPLAAWRVSLEGGDPIIGQELFASHGSAQCLVCHNLYGEGGQVGPILDKIGARTTREHLWESIVAPNNAIAPGFGVISVSLKDGTTKTGTFLSSSEKGVSMKLPDGKKLTIPRNKIDSQTTPLSGMPNMTQLLKPHEVRDIVAYLVTVKDAPKKKKKKGGKH